jgi:hypothetical protein
VSIESINSDAINEEDEMEFADSGSSGNETYNWKERE